MEQAYAIRETEYRIWRCNNKFSNETHCCTPTLDTETVQAQFITAYNRLMRDRRLLVEDCELMRTSLTDFALLDAQIEKAEEEANVVAELVNGLVRENASTAQSQDAYLRKYEALTQRYEAAKAELDRLLKERTLRSQQDKSMALFIRTLKKQPEVLDAWDDTVWTVMVEKAIIHRDGTITFVFYNGTEIAVERQAA